MTERIGRLVKVHNVPPEAVLGLTFSRNSAEEMRQRLIPVLGESASRVTLSTIHSFCHYLLRTEGKTFEILSGKEQAIFVKKIMNQTRAKDISMGMVLHEIGLAKNNLITPEDFKEIHQGDRTVLKIAEIYERYEKEKMKKYLLDFDDLLLEAHRLLNENDEIRSKYTERYLHLLVDEYQDINPVAHEILRNLINDSEEESSFWVAGDDWQAIYSFQGSSVGNILNFESTFRESRIFILNLNYRSTPQILKACQNLISHNRRKIEKTLTTHNEDGDDVLVLESSSEEGEALNLVNEITELVRRGFKYTDIAVLYRANFQSRVVEEVLSKHKIPYHIQNGLHFYKRYEIRVVLDYLRVISDPNSEAGDEALKNVINVPNRYIGKKFMKELEQFANKRDLHLYEGLKTMQQEVGIDLPYIRMNVIHFIQFMEPLVDFSSNMSPSEVIQLLRDTMDLDRYFTDSDLPSPDDMKILNLNQLQLAAARYSDIKSFLEYTDTFQEEVTKDKEGISLMTIHKSKGLEFPVVFLIGLVEGIIPAKKGDIEEERRIAFVGISRAMKILYISYSRTYLGQAVNPSLFLYEILGLKKE